MILGGYMELTINEALLLGAEKHKEGNLEEAQRLYRAVLDADPSHPDANHNLGLLAIAANRADVALPLFKRALGGNSSVVQFWLSYIDALITQKQFQNARIVLEEGKNQGVIGTVYDDFNKRLASIFSLAEKYSKS
jgi:tetratricopeptide (TPR) repeat protein